MIYLFSIILIINLAKSQIEVDLSQENEWTYIQNTLNTSTFKVRSLQTEYCYVRIGLKYQDPTFLLMADYKVKPNSNLISTYKQGEKIDRISQLENRGTRFLKLKGNAGTIYITTMADYKNNYYQITITGNNEEECDNDCNQNGICETEGCICNGSFIGNDCHQLSQELVSQTQQDVYFVNDETIKFFSINLYYFLGQTLKLQFESNCQECLNIIIYKTKALFRPEETQQSNYTQLFSFSNGLSTIQTKIPDILPAQQQILYLSVFKQYSNNETTHLQIRFNYEPQSYDIDENINSTRLIYIIIPSVFGSLLFFLCIGCLINRRRKAIQAQSIIQGPFYQQPRNVIHQDPFFNQNRNINHQDPFSQQPRNPINQDPFFNQNRDQFPQQPQIQIVQPPASQFLWPKEEPNNDDDKCIICFYQLNYQNNTVVKINCGHQFHRDCIKGWCIKQQSIKQDKQSDCPYCRCPMDLNLIF